MQQSEHVRSRPGGVVLVTGGAGYIGSILVPRLLPEYRVVVLDLCLFGDASLRRFGSDPRLEVVRGDIRDERLVSEVLERERPDAIISLAAVSNDPCSEIDPEVTRSINLDGTARLMRLAKELGVRRFVSASSASVYGVKEEEEVTEDLPLEPLTLYARYKAETEGVLASLVDERFCGVSVRAATVCGWSPRLRLDLTINILTYHAITERRIRVFGGAQMRPSIHVDDVADFYALLLRAAAGSINGRAFNVSAENASVAGLAEMVRAEIDPGLPIVVVPTADNRSYRLTARLAKDVLGFAPRRALRDAVRDLRAAFSDGRVPDPAAAVYRNIEVMKEPSVMAALRGSAA
ncbi:MAG: NAD-dependent epimerase/dehydratase [Deltaproteobacteria bacterium]|nr:NAD-dependent epimerase/dehydratase [Deltaproteobacteria bacterium]